MFRNRVWVMSLVFAVVPWQGAQATCWEAAASKFGVNPMLLQAVAYVESNLNPDAMNFSHLKRTNTFDIGLMQINSSWLKQLKSFGIDQDALRVPCVNLQVGAWILSDLLSRFGDTWNAVGAYNAVCSTLSVEECSRVRAEYAWRVYRRFQKLKTASAKPQSTPASQAVAAPVFASEEALVASGVATNKSR